MSASAPEVLLPHQTMHRNGRIGRFGVAYLRAIAASAGVGFAETSPDEDVLAVDGGFAMKNGDVRVQVKTSTVPNFNQAGEARIRVEDWHWGAWAANRHPVYGVLIAVENCDDALWMDTSADDITRVPAAAYWTRVSGPDITQRTGPMVFSRSRRFTVDTIGEISATLDGGYGA